MRIFVTVGAQMPFDRLIGAIDAWAGEHPEHEVLAQIGESALAPVHVRHSRFMAPAELERAYDDADAIVGHAGIGTIFAALERRKPIVIVPRRAALRETRNDHQVATAKRFASQPGVLVAWDETELAARMSSVSRPLAAPGLRKVARGGLVRAIREFIGPAPSPHPAAQASADGRSRRRM